MEGGILLAAYKSYPDGLLKQVTDGAGNTTVYQYDRYKQVTGLTITSPDGSMLYQEKNTYDKNGSLLTQSISGAEYNNETLKYTYDALDHLVSETKNGQKTTYTYDVMGNRLTKTEVTALQVDCGEKVILEM